MIDSCRGRSDWYFSTLSRVCFGGFPQISAVRRVLTYFPSSVCSLTWQLAATTTTCPSTRQRRGSDNTPALSISTPPNAAPPTSEPPAVGCNGRFIVVVYMQLPWMSIDGCWQKQKLCYEQRYIIIIVIIILTVHPYCEANDCRLGCAKKCVYLNNVHTE